ncbi:MAG: bacteriohemerythrin [Leptospiraceae bacterium]|nr:bacteriohemerythrin [Leptospiraceae bacterium]
MEKYIQLVNAYSKFIPLEFLSILEKEDILQLHLGDMVKKEMTVFYTDIRSFTTISESLTPEENIVFLNSYLKKAVPIISKNGGFIDKFIGDAILAVFPKSVDDAVQTGIDLIHMLRNYNLNELSEKNYKIKVNIGINSGEMMIGVIGNDNRMECTVISDTVNTAARLEEIGKEYGTYITISNYAIANLEEFERFHFRFLDRLKVRGKEILVPIYEVFDCDRPEVIEKKIDTKLIFEQGVLHYIQKEYNKSFDKFVEVLKINPDDKAALFYLHRAAHYMTYGFSETLLQTEKLIVWTKDYEIGIFVIDEQHKKLVEIINELHKAISDKMETGVTYRILQQLNEYTLAHFSIEEEIMKKIKYPEFDLHKAMHGSFIDKVNRFKDDYLAGKKLSGEIMVFLREWLTNHILHSDKDGIGKFYFQNF